MHLLRFSMDVFSGCGDDTLFGNWLGYMWYCARMDEKNDVEVKNEDYVKSWMVLGDFVPKDKKKDMNRD